VNIKSSEDADRVKKRLRRIEGQVRGIQRMIDEERDCREVVQQLAAVKSAVQQAGIEVMKVYATECLTNPNEEESQEEVLNYLFNTLGRWG
jgi:DNA-binding FrmR family transcriptional regulator